MAIYDKFAPYYDKLFKPFETRFLNQWRKETLSKLPTSATILEIGSGTGANFPFYPESKIAVSSEISEQMIKIAAQKTDSAILIQADAQDLPFPPNSFDAAFATLVFCSIPDPAKAFYELRRVVKPGGMIVLLEHVRPPRLLGLLFDFLNIFTTFLIDDHFNRQTAKLAAEHGLAPVGVTKKAAGIINIIVCVNKK